MADRSYFHAQPFTTLWTLMPVTSLGVAAVLWLTGDPQAQLGIGIVLSTTVVTLAVMGRLVIELRGDVLHWQFGWLGVPRGSLPLDQVLSCHTATGSASGAGIRGTRQAREVTAALSSPGVKLVLKDGRSLFLGSPEPDRLQRLITARLPHPPAQRR
jgi:hypothetical protein